MITVAHAWQLIRDAMAAQTLKDIAVGDAAGAILGEDVYAERDQPPFDRVMMDGIALRFDVEAPARDYSRQGVQAAGAEPLSLVDDKHCIEVMTGAVLPGGCDTVIPVEQIQLSPHRVTLAEECVPAIGQFIHRRGSDYGRDEKLLTRGTLVRGPEMAVLVSSGMSAVSVAKPPRIAITAVGDELVDPGLPIGVAQVRRSNDFAIAALLQTHGLLTHSREKLPDDPQSLRTSLASTVRSHDVVVLTGGVSMGKFDYIPRIMNELGVKILLHKVAQKPGKPIWVGQSDGTIVFALPGNPVSALVCARRYVIPAIQHAMGYHPASDSVRLARPVSALAELESFVAVTLNSDGDATLRATNTSGDFRALSGTAGFVALAAGSGLHTPGECVALWRW